MDLRFALLVTTACAIGADAKPGGINDLDWSLEWQAKIPTRRHAAITPDPPPPPPAAVAPGGPPTAQQQHDCGPGATYTRDPAACARIPPPPTHDPALTADAVRAKLDALRWKGRGRRVPAGTALAGMYVDARSKTIFCPIFKNAHTAFTHYFHRLRDGSGTVSRRGQTNGWFNRARGCSRGDVAERWGTPQYNATRAYCNAYYDTWLPERPYAKRLGDYTTREAANMLADPAWLKAVVVRDPLERLLSFYIMAFASLWEPPNQGPQRRYQDQFTMWTKDATNFSHFVEVLAGPTRPMNPHWVPQATQCGLDTLPEVFNAVGTMSGPRGDLAGFAKALFGCNGSWRACGATGWGRYHKVWSLTPRHPDYFRSCKAARMCGSDAERASFNKRPGSAAFMQGNLAGHRTGAAAKLERYGATDPRVVAAVRKYYADDYALIERFFSPA